MNLLDVRTVMISQLVTNAACTAVLVFLWVTNRKRFAGTFYWVIDFAFQTVALMMILARGSIPAWVSMGVSNTLVVAGALMGYMGLTRFVAWQTRQMRNYIFLAVFLAVHLYFIFVQPNLAARNLNVSLGLLVMCVQCVWLVVFRAGRELRRMTLWAGLVFAVFCLVSVLRIIVILLIPSASNDFFRSGFYDTVLLMAYQMLLILLTFAVAVMFNQRLLREVRGQEEKFATAFRSSPYAITLTRPSDGQMLDVNDGFVTISGYSYAEAVGKTTRDLQLWVRDVDRADVTRELSEGNRVAGREYQFRKRSGELVTGLFAAEIIRIDDQPCILSSISDITERKRAEEEKAKLEGQLQQAHKMETVGQLAGGVAHDFNNMLQVILSYVEISLTKVDAGQPLQKYLLEIRGAAKRSAEITGQLLAFARKQTASPKVIDLNEAVASMQKMIQRSIGEEIGLAWMPGNDLWKVKIDPTQLNQILANLAVNARDAIGGVGRLTIETENVTFDEAYCAAHVGSVLGEYVLIAVSDNGCGMDKETLSHLFEPFFTTKGIGKGTGLGLATIYGIIRQNDGFISAYSKPGEGSTFKVYLPRARGAEDADAEEVEAVTPRGGTETVLVVEDEKAIREMVQLSLEQLGYTVLSASSPEEGLRMCEEVTCPIQLLITDVVMPQMNGRQLAERLRVARPGLKCLYMSGYTADVIARRGVLEEGVSFAAKPFSLAALAGKVREAIDGPAGDAASTRSPPC